jgi:hypothetical protein
MLGLNMEKKVFQSGTKFKTQGTNQNFTWSQKILNGTKNYTWNKTKLCRGGGGRAGAPFPPRFHSAILL